MLNGSSIETDLDDWQQMIDLNLTALVTVTKAALPHLLASARTSSRGVADIVNISSIAGRVANAQVAVYNVTKFGVTAFSESLRQEFTRENLRVAVIEPGAVDTELYDHARPASQRHYETLFAGVEKLHPEDVSELVGYLVTRPRRVAINEVVMRPTDQV
jgi:NADP-dependent 3-hydroxy acid dehydrogenase YdfG